MFVCFGGEEVFITDFDLNSSQWKNPNSATKGLIPGYSSYNFTMRLFYLLWLFFLLLNVDKSFQQIACPTLPDVPHAHVSEETKRAEYQGGHMIHFTCEPGSKISGTTIRYVCSSEGWLAIGQGTCSPCPTLPDVPHAHVSEDTKRAEYQGGHMIHFTCEPGSKISGTSIRYVCSSEGWLSIGQGTCSPCPTLPDVPHAHVSEETKRAEYQGGHVIHFTCEPGYKKSGPNIKYVCTSEGWLAVEQGTCSQITCQVGAMPPHVSAVGLPPGTITIKAGRKLQFQCDNASPLDGPQEIECLLTGEWNANFPTCDDKCTVKDVPNTVRMTPRTLPNNQLRKGQQLRFACTNRRDTLLGNAEVECLANGEWSHDFPTCGDPLTCGTPPILIDGDITTSSKTEYSHGERVEYSCQNYYTMAGGPYKTCNNGEWTGSITCLKPCTVNKHIMASHNIRFRYSHFQRLYVSHNDVIEFSCTRGRPVSTVEMRQTCLNGQLDLPICF
ncbi:complement factor H-related protein 1-like isoform X2 [Centropristis striata]|uniref:complement factor H-related protein 1-like isoform X2 n=1 Tax=Centropristis striata TaxID=184440 RepID=UPI0027E18C55|nr:complement factor H-related protein 1-like isoform X2 [Centropristis striata]